MPRHRLDAGRRAGVAMALLAIAWPGPAAAQGLTVDALAATVGTHIIMLSDVRLARDLETPGVATDEALLVELVNRSLMLAEVERFQQPDPPATAVDAALEARRTQLGPAAWAAMLRRDGVDEAYLRAYLRDDLRLETYLGQRFTTLSEPSDDDVSAAFAARQRERPDATATLERLAPMLRTELAERRFAALVAEWIAELRARGEVSVRGVPAGAGTARD